MVLKKLIEYFASNVNIVLSNSYFGALLRMKTSLYLNYATVGALPRIKISLYLNYATVS